MRRLAYSVLRSDVKLEPEQAEGLPYVGLEHVASWTGRLLPLDDQLTPEGAANAFEAGDVLFGKLRPYLAKALCADFGGVCSTEFLVLKPRDYERRYLLYLLLTDGFISYVDSSTYGAKMPRASWDFIGDSLLPLPPVEEQRAIAAFLDRETGRIDLLIGKKRLLIERLREYRTALITRAVTRGLPSEAARSAGLEPSPRLKSSGVEWLGDVPSHWEVVPTKYVCQVVMGQSPPSDAYTDEPTERPFLQGNAEFGKQHPTPKWYCDAAPKFVEAGASLLSVRAPVGALNLADQTLGIGRGLCAVISNSEVVDQRFTWWTLHASRTSLAALAVGSTYEAVSVSEVGDVAFPVPPLEEQHAIVDFLDHETARIDELETQVHSAIERLQEYRSALITSAVTGKIDVRDGASVRAERGE